MANYSLSEIWIYPIKSLGGIRLQQARVLEKGLEFDRRWMLVDEHNRFITQREHPRLALFQVRINNEQLVILHQANQESAQFSMKTFSTHAEQVIIRDDKVQAVEVCKQLSLWFSEQLRMKCRLMFFPETNARPVDKEYAKGNENVSLADGYPFLIIGQASLDDLNSRLQVPVTMRRFRPNFVFTGGEPYEEDHWKNFTIGDLSFAGVKNCSRCVLTTVDPETGTMGAEPLRTLSSYRKVRGKVNLGQNAVTFEMGKISVGEKIIVP